MPAWGGGRDTHRVSGAKVGGAPPPLAPLHWQHFSVCPPQNRRLLRLCFCLLEGAGIVFSFQCPGVTSKVEDLGKSRSAPCSVEGLGSGVLG